jgi:parvulin-like peptidyl-prolyl isomerase
MTRQLTIAAVLLLGISAGAQVVASHAPTVDTNPASTSAPKSAALQVTGNAVARVNGAVLTDRDLVREMFTIFPYARQHSEFPKSMEAQIRQGALDMIIFEELVYQEARRQKLTISAVRMNAAGAEFKKQFSSQAEFQQFLKAEFNGSRQLFHEKLRRSLLIQKFLTLEVENKAAISAAELQAFYDKNPSKFEHPEAFAIQSISILPPKNASPEVLKEAQTRAQEVLRQAKATRNYQEFGLLAEKVSDDDYRVNMGDHKLVEREKLPPEIVKAAQAMKPGEVSDMIVVGNNYTLFRLNVHVAAGKVKLAEIKQQLRSDLQKQKYEQLRTELNKRLQKNAKVEVL